MIERQSVYIGIAQRGWDITEFAVSKTECCNEI